MENNTTNQVSFDTETIEHIKQVETARNLDDAIESIPVEGEQVTLEIVEPIKHETFTRETVVKLCEIAYIAGAKTKDNEGWSEQITDMESAFDNAYLPIYNTWVCQDDISMTEEEKGYITSYANRAINEGINENVFIFK